MLVVQSNLYILLDDRSTELMRMVVAIQSPFVLTLAFFMFYQMSELNSMGKRLLIPRMDYIIHRMNVTNKLKLKCSNVREMIATDHIAISMASIFMLNRFEIIRSFMQILNNIFLLIDVNR